MDKGSFFILIVLGVVFGILYYLFGFLIAKRTLTRWADENGYEILDCRPCFFWWGPFFWISSKHQKVFRVGLRDRAGRVRRAWVRCGSFWWGTWKDTADVKWDD